jgi:hypothetical protein
LLGSWPQADIGIVLWSLSVSAGDWQTREKLTRLCTIPELAMLTGAWDRSAFAMEARILRPLLWFGLLEYRSEKIPDSRFGARHYYRKAALFDRLLTFDVKMEFAKGPVTDGLEAGYEPLVLLTADEKVRPPAACSRTKKSGQ